jgi:hypothetical protein
MTDSILLEKIIKLRNHIIKLNDDEFMKWYNNQLVYYDSSTSLVHKAVKDSTNNIFYKLFNHLNSYYEDEFDAYNDLIKINKNFTHYYVIQCKKELVNKINEDNNLPFWPINDNQL